MAYKPYKRERKIKIEVPGYPFFRTTCENCSCQFVYHTSELHLDNINSDDYAETVVNCPSCNLPLNHRKYDSIKEENEIKQLEEEFGLITEDNNGTKNEKTEA